MNVLAACRCSIVAVSDRRAASRLEVIGQARAYLATVEPALTLRDLSEGGACLETPAYIEAGATTFLRFVTTAGDEFVLPATTVYCRKPTPLEGSGEAYIAGFAFVNAAPGIIDSLLTAITELPPVI